MRTSPLVHSPPPFTADLLGNFPSLDFNSVGLYPNGIAEVRITTVAAVPESSTMVFSVIAMLTLGLTGYLKKRKCNLSSEEQDSTAV